MAIDSLPFDHSISFGAGLAATNAMAVDGIAATDNLLAMFYWASATGATPNDVVLTDVTVGAGTLTCATTDLSSQTFCAIWTSAAAR
jgi:hypothetical protein